MNPLRKLRDYFFGPGAEVPAEPEPFPMASDAAIAAADVFTPTSPAIHGFVPRVKESKLLTQALGTRGSQVVTFGESGAGKSSLVSKTLRDSGRKYIVTRCTSQTDYDAVIKSAFDKLGAFEVTSTQTSESTSAHVDTSATVGSELLGGSVKFEGGVASVVENVENSVRVVEYQLTAENLAVALSKRDLSWVIEDFHKVDDDTRNALADVLKVFSDNNHPSTAVIVIGATESAAAVVEAPADVTRRVARIQVPPLTDDQLGAILDTGGDLMHVDFSAVREEIVRKSAGVASVTHALALRCLQELEIDTPPEVTIEISDHTLREAGLSYAASMQSDIKERFEKGLYLKRKRKYDNCGIILRAIASLPESGGTHAEILAKIRESIAEYPPSNLTSYLVELGSEDRGSLIRKAADGKHRFDEPMQHTYAQIIFDLEPAADDLYASELETQVSEEDRERAAAAAAELGFDEE